ncbi:MAG TPA: hypothetical protein VNW26_00210 [Steroidobacteraceae bacterium]|jgi:hypothetical protein|nr:hypothetical protein [Steroidobacteraceae bacterium]
MSDQNAAMGAALVDSGEQRERLAQIAAEYWARRTMWLLVTVTSLWDIAVTFDKYLGFTGRFIYAALGR